MTINEAKGLKRGDVVFYKDIKNKDGSRARYRVNGVVQIWKKTPSRFKVPLKRGLYEYGYITEENVEDFVREEERG